MRASLQVVLEGLRAVSLGGLVLGCLLAGAPAHAVTWTVDSLADDPDQGGLNGDCKAQGNKCTLRAAIQEANFTVAADTINFSVSGTIILTNGLLPAITQPVTIVATTGNASWPGTAPYAPVVAVNGNGLSIIFDLQPGSSGSTIRGLCLYNATVFPGAIRIFGSSNNVIAGNFIGTNLAGTAAGPGNVIGIFVGDESPLATNDNRIGVDPAAVDVRDRNVISANTLDGIEIRGGTGGAARTIVAGNYIGTDVNGTADLGNTNQGIVIFGTSNSNTVIGGTALNAGNVISGNNGTGLLFGGAGTTGTLVRGNKIGTNTGGTLAIPNTVAGIGADNFTANHTIGGTAAGARNLISGNGDGIRLNNASSILVQGNYIGTDVTGAASLPNTGAGIVVYAGGSNNTIGGTAVDAGNVISGNGARGVEIREPGTNGNVVQGNKIGTNAAGTASVRNNIAGISIATSATNNTIGGTSASARNIISGNGDFSAGNGDGIRLNNASSNFIQGNYIGTDVTGAAALPNTGQGIVVFGGGSNNTIGGTAAGAGNVISGNSSGRGIEIKDPGANGNIVQGNKIGTNEAGTGGVPNQVGVSIAWGPDNNIIGGTTASAGNIIAYNTTDGMHLVESGDPTLNNQILGNAFHSNGSIGIDLADNEVTPNDAAPDSDGGPNNLQNFPVLSAASTTGLGNANFAGHLDSAANTTFRIEFFANTAADPTGFGEGQRYLDFTNVTTNGAGTITFGVSRPVSLTAGEAVTATATVCTDGPACTAFGSTSEFSAAIVASGELIVTTTADNVDGTTTNVSTLIANPGADGRISLREAIAATNAAADLNIIRFGIPPAGAKTIVLGSALPSITRPVTIDGTTQPGWVNAAPFAPVIELHSTSAGDGLQLNAGASGSTIRGLCINRAAANGNAILIDESSTNIIAGNFLGTNLAGTAPGPGNFFGVFILGNGANNNRIGGTAPADRNIISANVEGILIHTTAGTIANNLVQGNYIGTDVNGTADLGNTNQGIELRTSSGGELITNTTIGGTAPGAGNVISGNGDAGVEIDGIGTTGTLVQGNKIGTNALGMAGIANGKAGVSIIFSASNNTVGGTAANAGNLIAYNSSRGIELSIDTTVNNAILGNAIRSNGGLGIDLMPMSTSGVTPNDAGDGDAGPNDLLNFPLLTAIYPNAGTLTTHFQLDVPAGSYRIEFFKNPSGVDASGFGEGEAFAATVPVNHPGGGPQPFNHAFAGIVGDRITATATRCTDGAACTTPGSTSEFSKALTVVTTAVTLLSFRAEGREEAVDLSWTTASELSNLGFHLYRAEAAGGPYTRITTSLIPGLGSSPTGRSYAYRDSGLVNGRTYYYQLEDVETTGRTERHGPVSATTSSETDRQRESTYGDPSGVVLREIERDGGHVLLELVTPGFEAVPTADGRVRVSIPGFTSVSEAGEPHLPTRRAFVEAVAGQRVRLASVTASDELRFPGLRPTVQGAPGIEVDENGAVLPSEEERREGASFDGIFPSASAVLLGGKFQGETKKAEVLLFPLRWDGSGLVLSRRLVVRLDFVGREAGETSLGGSRGRRAVARSGRIGRGLRAQLVAKERGLYAVSFEDVFPGRPHAMPTEVLRLSRQGDDVAFHVEPDPSRFAPGSTLYFVSEGSELNPYGDAVYELETGIAGTLMPVDLLTVASAPVDAYYETVRREKNQYYQAGLLEAPDLWLWDVLVSPDEKSYTFTADHVSAARPAYVSISLQGASDFDGLVDHHVRVSVNGTYLGEASWDGKEPKSLDLEVGPGVLQEGLNALELENVADTGAAYSLVFMNRFSVRYPRGLVGSGGALEGTFASSGQAVVGALPSSSVVLDTTGTPRWRQGAVSTPTGLSFAVEAGRRYLATSVVQRPQVRKIQGSALRKAENQADYVLLAPKAFLNAAKPLLDLRQSEGLRTMGVSLEDVYEQFGHGEVSPEAIKAFLEYAYHSWASPSVRYVVLLGDASYDPKDYLGTGVKDWLPGFPVKTSYLRTVSDPAYSSVNGEDLLPDLAIGRLPASSVREAERLVRKVLAFENGGGRVDGPAVLVADNADAAGNFEHDADEIASGVLEGRKVRKIYYSEQGANTRAAITQAFDDGASLMSYVGHGATAVWASENIFRNQDVSSLVTQSRQPLLLTMNCLNGFFHFPPLNSLSEELLKADGKGAIAAFSPSGLSLNDAAHVYHKALLQEILSDRHARLGDAVLAAQREYADSGAFPELLSIYHLFGDPALRIR